MDRFEEWLIALIVGSLLVGALFTYLLVTQVDRQTRHQVQDCARVGGTWHETGLQRAVCVDSNGRIIEFY